MKKLVVGVLAAAVIASVAYAQSNQVLSRNAVGYYRFVVNRTNMQLVTSPFNNMSGGATPSNVFGFTTLPIGTVLSIWNNDARKYQVEGLSSNPFTHVVAWTPGTNRLDTTVGFWVRIPTNAPMNSYTGFLMGEVPDRITAPTSDVDIYSNLNMIGFGYPVDVLWTNTDLAKNAAVGSYLSLWKGSSYIVNSLSSNPFTHVKGWTYPTQVITVGQGFWFTSKGAAVMWHQVKPYTWP